MLSTVGRDCMPSSQCASIQFQAAAFEIRFLQKALLWGLQLLRQLTSEQLQVTVKEAISAKRLALQIHRPCRRLQGLSGPQKADKLAEQSEWLMSKSGIVERQG
ncbi:hypothetical protein HispidOSU_006718 [Sigmodon hispidus]